LYCSLIFFCNKTIKVRFPTLFKGRREEKERERKWRKERERTEETTGKVGQGGENVPSFP